MDIPIRVSGQKMRIPANYKFIAPGSQKFVKFIFDLSSDWDDLTIFAQFCQNGKPYNQYLDENNSVDLPIEITTGKCTLMLYGTGSDNVIGTTNYLTLNITSDILVANADSTEISESLYQQLVNKVDYCMSLQGLDLSGITIIGVSDDDIATISDTTTYLGLS